MNKTIYIIRGLPGSGKTTLAHKISDVVVEADDYFTDESGIYRFNPKELDKAHDYCRDAVENMMACGKPLIAVANTFIKRWEMGPYFTLAEQYSYSVHEIVCRGQFKSVHNVPGYVINRMANRWED